MAKDSNSSRKSRKRQILMRRSIQNSLLRWFSSFKRSRMLIYDYIFLDEAIFSFNTFKIKAMSKPYKNIVIKDQAIKVKIQALIAAISLEDGFFDYLLQLSLSYQKNSRCSSNSYQICSIQNYLPSSQTTYQSTKLTYLKSDFKNSRQHPSSASLTPHNSMGTKATSLYSRISTRTCCFNKLSREKRSIHLN